MLQLYGICIFVVLPVLCLIIEEERVLGHDDLMCSVSSAGQVPRGCEVHSNLPDDVILDCVWKCCMAYVWK
jgi:hypothetical protein